jgi:hypothetical protein
MRIIVELLLFQKHQISHFQYTYQKKQAKHNFRKISHVGFISNLGIYTNILGMHGMIIINFPFNFRSGPLLLFKLCVVTKKWVTNIGHRLHRRLGRFVSNSLRGVPFSSRRTFVHIGVGTSVCDVFRFETSFENAMAIGSLVRPFFLFQLFLQANMDICVLDSGL